MERNMNNKKIKVCKSYWKKLLKKYDVAEDFINNRIHEISSREKFSGEEVIYFLVGFL